MLHVACTRARHNQGFPPQPPARSQKKRQTTKSCLLDEATHRTETWHTIPRRAEKEKTDVLNHIARPCWLFWLTALGLTALWKGSANPLPPTYLPTTRVGRAGESHAQNSNTKLASKGPRGFGIWCWCCATCTAGLAIDFTRVDSTLRLVGGALRPPLTSSIAIAQSVRCISSSTWAAK